MKLKRIYIIFILVSVICPSYFLNTAFAAEKEITDINVVLGKEEISVSAKLTDGLNKDVEEAIKNGIQKDIIYSAILKKKRSAWFDEDVASKEIKYTIKYDVLKKQYTLITRGNGNKEKVTQSYDEIKSAVSRMENTSVSPKKVLELDEEYYVSIKAEIKDTKLLFFLDYFLFFIPFSDINTSWYDSPVFNLEKVNEK
ncbi:MAG: DUF4390 domain-containing protein [Nitrospirae bacterium]|nr:DUF4390 domain-containing protein [Nitrospirota bacterium]